jgi:U3 small nucleolar RNA-associated protein 14
MAKLRALLFYHEQKAKRASKIKSKSYRRLKRKEKERKAMTLEQLKEMDPDFADEDIMERERRRAEERVSLRHKNGGKWGKKMARFNVHDTEVSTLACLGDVIYILGSSLWFHSPEFYFVS